MNNYKIKKDHGTHWEMHDQKDGKTFLVAKKGLSKKLTDQITGMQHLDDGGYVDPLATSPTDLAPQPVAGPALPSSADSVPVPVDSTPLADVQGVGSGEHMQSIQQVMDANDPQIPHGPLPDPIAYDPNKPVDPNAAPKGVPVPGQQLQGAPPAVVNPMDALQYPSAPKGVSTAGLTRAAGEEKGALDQQANVAGQRATADQGIQEQLQKAEEQRQQDQNTALKTEQARGDAFRKAAETGKVNPNDYFESKDTMGKLGVMFAVVLGGYTQRQNGGKNFALEQLNKDVDANIQRQKDTIVKNMDMAKMSDQKMADINNDMARKKVDLLTLAKIKLDETASKFGGPEAQAKAAELKGAIDKQLATTQITVAEGSANRDYQYRMGRFGFDLQKAQAKAQQPTQELIQQMYGGTPFDPRMQTILPEKDRERAVNLGNGSMRLAIDHDSAADYRKVQSGREELQGIVKEMRAGMEENGRGVPGSAWSAKADSLRSQALTQWNQLAKLARLSDPEVKLFEKIVPDPSQWKQGQAEEMINGMQRALDTAGVSANRNLLLGGNTGAGGGSAGGFRPKTAADY